MKLTSIPGLLSLSAVLLSSHLPAAAQNCRPLSLLGGEGSEVTKSVSQPTVPGPFGVTISIAIKLTRNFLILMEYESNPINP